MNLLVQREINLKCISIRYGHYFRKNTIFLLASHEAFKGQNSTSEFMINFVPLYVCERMADCWVDSRIWVQESKNPCILVRLSGFYKDRYTC